MDLEQLAKELGLERVKIRGNEIHASCPFPERHDSGHDKRPSFSINVAKGVYNCFSCGSRGILEELVSKLREIPISSAVSLLDQWGLSKFDRASLEEEIEEVEELPEGLLFYFDKVEDEYAELYEGEVNDRDCIIFPVRRRDGVLVGAIARSKEGKWHKVMWNMSKKSFLYGEEKIEEEKPLVIVEGPGDVIALRKAGINNAVALMGILVSKEQIEKLLNLSSDFIVWLDKDESGAKGMNSLRKKLEKRASVRYVVPWRVKEISTKGDAKQVFEDYGPEKVREILKNSKTLFEITMED